MAEQPDSIDGEPETPGVPGATPVTYEQMHRFVGYVRSPLKPLMERYGRGEGLEGLSSKERTGALEALVLNELHAHILTRRAQPHLYGVHGLAVVEGFEDCVGPLTHPPEEGLAAMPDPGSIRWRPVTAEELLPLREQAPLPRHMQAFDAIDMLSNVQMGTMLLAMHQWESDRMRHAGSGSAVDRLYGDYIAAVAEHRPQLAPAGVDYPAFRKLIKGFLFGSPFQWGVIGRFRQFANELGMPWNAATFDALMDGMGKQAKRSARMHGSILTMQSEMLAHGGVSLADMIGCKRDGERVEFFVLPAFMAALGATVADPGVPEMLRRLDNGPITDCTALHSEMFDGTLEWNAAIAKDLMLPDGDRE